MRDERLILGGVTVVETRDVTVTTGDETTFRESCVVVRQHTGDRDHEA